MTTTRLPKTITAGALLATPIPPVKWIIPGLLPAGLAIFAGPSKAGKSWLTLWLCLQISQGKSVWGREIEPRTVLYFSLEDTLGRLQERLYQDCWYRCTEPKMQQLEKGEMPMVAGRLQEKNGFYYIVLSYTDSAGKRRQPWIATGLTVKGNKKRAEKMLADTRKDFTIPKGQVSELSPDMAFSDYMRYWLKMMRTAVTETTYSSYCFNVEKHIIPYFEPLGVTLAGLQPRQIQSFYLHEAETLKNTSILRFHANLHKALKYAVRIDLITSNPVDKVDRPKPQAFMASYYSAEEMEKLFEAAQGHKLELIIQLAAFYGLRRAEVMGLRWEAIDFEAKTLTIRHIVTSTRIDGKKILVEADRAKTKSSLRTLPLVDPIAERLKAVKEQQEYNQKICGNCYNQEYLGYVFVDAMGNLIQPDSVTTGFPQLLKENGLRRIRFHDLRHSCASLLLKEGVPMKQIQEWLGHSDISTTANIYAHLDSQSKNLSARTMANTLTLPEAQPVKKW